VQTFSIPFEEGYRQFMSAYPAEHKVFMDVLYFDKHRFDNIGKLVTSHDLRSEEFELTLKRASERQKRLVATADLKSMLVLRLDRAGGADSPEVPTMSAASAMSGAAAGAGGREDESQGSEPVTWQIDSQNQSNLNWNLTSQPDSQSQSHAESFSQQLLTQDSAVLAEEVPAGNSGSTCKSGRKRSSRSSSRSKSAEPAGSDSQSQSLSQMYDGGDNDNTENTAYTNETHETNENDESALLNFDDYIEDDTGILPDKHELLKILRPILEAPVVDDDEEDEEDDDDDDDDDDDEIFNADHRPAPTPAVQVPVVAPSTRASRSRNK